MAKTYRVAELVITSNGTLLWYNPSATSERVTPTGGSFVQEEAQFGCLLPDPFAVKTIVDTRYDFRAASTSRVTVAWVDDLGGVNSHASTTLTLSSGSATSQYQAPVQISARYPQLRLTSQDGGTWRLARYAVRARVNTEF